MFVIMKKMFVITKNFRNLEKNVFNFEFLSYLWFFVAVISKWSLSVLFNEEIGNERSIVLSLPMFRGLETGEEIMKKVF